MVNEEKLRKLYAAIIDKVELTTKNLKELGFSSKDLNDLIEDNKLVRVQRGLYALKDVNKLFLYGKFLLSLKEYNMATECFERCHEIDPTYSPACFQLFLRSIQAKDYDSAIKLYRNISNTSNEFYNSDARFYLYILSLITDLPEEYREYAKNLTFDDIKVSDMDKRYNDPILHNNMRSTLLNGSLYNALLQFNNTISKKDGLKVYDLIVKILLNQAMDKNVKNRYIIIDMLKEKKYNELIDYLLDEKYKHNLTLNDRTTLVLVQKLVEIRDTKRIPERQMYTGGSVFKAIEHKDYYTALKLSTSNDRKRNIAVDSDPINMLLNDICELIKELSNKKEVKVEDKPNDTYSLIISSLIKKDYASAYSNLSKYMNSIGKQEYEFLIATLIKISILENDIAYTKPMVNLTLISMGSFKFDVSNYISEFYMALSSNKLEEARLYLDIISKSKLFGGESIDTENLYEILDVKVEIKEEVNEIKEIEEIKPEVKEPIVINKVITKPVKLNKTSIASEEDIKTDERFIEKKHEELVQKDGVLLLRQMDEVRVNRLLKMIIKYKDMDAFTIGTGNKTQIVLVYKPKLDQFYDYKELVNQALGAYENKDYQKCIEIELLLLKIFNGPRSNTYIKLGLSYMKIYDKESAIKYLTIANDLALKEDVNFDFSDMILTLKGDLDFDDAKRKVHMNEKDFDSSNLDDYFGFIDFEGINNYIIESGLDLESACEELGMSPEDIDVLRLVYAREYYIMSNFKTGDLFLNVVERSKNKTDELKKLIKEVKESRKFYQNRIITEPRPTVLVLKPKKSTTNKTSE